MKKICGFCGHSDAPKCIRSKLKETITSLICKEHVQIFYVGSNGAFDRMAIDVLQDLHSSYPKIQYYQILAYMPRPESTSLNSCPTIFPEGLENVPCRAAIPRRNKWLVEQSDFLIAYVTRTFGGAANTLTYAQKRKIKIINLSETSSGTEKACP